MDIIHTHSQSYGGRRSVTPLSMHNGHRSRAFLGRLAPFAVQKTLEEQNIPRCCCCFAFACSGRRRSWATTTFYLFSPSVVMAQTAWSKRWIKPEIFPLFAAMGAALGICGFAIARNIAINPDVRISKEDRAAGILDNYKEGKTYKDHGLREYLKDCSPEIMPTLNRYFSTSK